MQTRYAAVLDTCALYSSLTRSLLLDMAEKELYRPLWSCSILEELGNNLQLKARLTPEQTSKLTEAMARAFPEALVEDNHPTIQQIQQSLHLPDVKDAHVIAAALIGKADAIVTFNLKDFPKEVLVPLGVEALGPDEVLVQQWDLNPILARQAVYQSFEYLKREPPTWDQWLERLKKVGLGRFVRKLSQSSSGLPGDRSLGRPEPPGPCPEG